MNAHIPLLWRIVSASAIPLILYCFPKHFSGLLYKDFTSFSTSSGVAYSQSCKALVSLHFNSRKRLSSSIINDPLHHFNPCLANALSSSDTRSSYKALRCRASLNSNSLIPSLARHLVNAKQKVDPLYSSLS